MKPIVYELAGGDVLIIDGDSRHEMIHRPTTLQGGVATHPHGIAARDRAFSERITSAVLQMTAPPIPREARPVDPVDRSIAVVRFIAPKPDFMGGREMRRVEMLVDPIIADAILHGSQDALVRLSWVGAEPATIGEKP